MSDFEKWFEDQDFYTNMRFIHGDKLLDRDGDVYRVLPVQMAYQAWDYRKAQLNNMEACYVEKKKEVDELQGKSRCIKSLVEQRNLAENMLRKISVAAQKKLPTFGAALRFNDEVKEILRGAND